MDRVGMVNGPNILKFIFKSLNEVKELIIHRIKKFQDDKRILEIT
jgi:hypothetical protein